jgi:hypothetical protein
MKLILTLCSLLIAGSALAQEPVSGPTAIAQTVTVLERIIPRECLTGVKFKDLSKCQITGVELGPDSQCRGNVGEKLVCTGFVVKVSPACEYVATRHSECENIHVKKVSSNANSSAPQK